MKTIEYRTEDKATWGAGDWQSEPDKKQWLDETTGLPCLIVRGPMGALCGYVGVSEGHPAFRVSEDDVRVDVHGGLTFADGCANTDDESRHVCHKVDDEQPVWWLGFDCSHAGDSCPKSDAIRGGGFWRGDAYRNFSYVTSEVESLARQLKAMETPFV